MITRTGMMNVAGTAACCSLLTIAALPAQGLTSQECGAKYQAAKTAGTLNGQKWNDFRKAQCGSDAAAVTPAPAAPTPTAAEGKPDTKMAKPAATPVSVGNASFPSAVDPKFAKESAGRARLHTCSEQWQANKAANATGGMKWIEKGGGYWSECNKRLKGA